ncbi:MAG: hypothetical protein II826_08160 [Prevotella sp.]|jgi:hypothetical protein|nr:hypothetical protein [Prevotella sp.]MBR6320755.1 hypothetical protein [Prevotella sp.]
MKQGDRWTNVLLGLLVVVLAAICFSTISSEKEKDTLKQKTEHARKR